MSISNRFAWMVACAIILPCSGAVAAAATPTATTGASSLQELEQQLTADLAALQQEEQLVMQDMQSVLQAIETQSTSTTTTAPQNVSSLSYHGRMYSETNGTWSRWNGTSWVAVTNSKTEARLNKVATKDCSGSGSNNCITTASTGTTGTTTSTATTGPATSTGSTTPTGSTASTGTTGTTTSTADTGGTTNTSGSEAGNSNSGSTTDTTSSSGNTGSTAGTTGTATGTGTTTTAAGTGSTAGTSTGSTGGTTTAGGGSDGTTTTGTATTGTGNTTTATNPGTATSSTNCNNVFSPTSFFNLPIGSGAQWIQNAQLAGSTIYVNTQASGYDQPVYTSTANDPVVTITNSASNGGNDAAGTFTLHIPAGAQPAPGGDEIISVMDTSNNTWYSLSGFIWTGSTTATTRQADQESNTGDGLVLNSDSDEGAGTLMESDLQGGAINHMLRIQLPSDVAMSYSQTSTNGLCPYCWPQDQEDGCALNGSGCPAYSGTVYYGVTMGIPAGTAEPSDVAGNAGADMLWKALMNHGAMVRDTGGSGNTLTLQGDQNVDAGDPLIQGMEQYSGEIMQHVEILGNQGPNSINGGGNPIVPMNSNSLCTLN